MQRSLDPLDDDANLYEHELMFILRQRPLLAGFAAWAVGAGLLRGLGHLVMPRTAAPAALLLAVTVVAFAAVAHFVFRDIPAATRASTALLFMQPTLVLDGFSAVFFTQVFPNIPPEAAGVFAGWMMASCAGVALGTFAYPAQ